MTFTICFDFPDEPDPYFALSRGTEPMGFTQFLDLSARYDTEEIAARVLANSYGKETASCGTVVEVQS